MKIIYLLFLLPLLTSSCGNSKERVAYHKIQKACNSIASKAGILSPKKNPCKCIASHMAEEWANRKSKAYITKLKKTDMLVQTYKSLLETECRHGIIKCFTEANNIDEQTAETVIDAVEAGIMTIIKIKG
jgi:hypothetical protein